VCILFCIVCALLKQHQFCLHAFFFALTDGNILDLVKHQATECQYLVFFYHSFGYPGSSVLIGNDIMAD